MSLFWNTKEDELSCTSHGMSNRKFIEKKESACDMGT